MIYDACTKKPVDIGISWETGTFIRVNRSKFRSYLLTGIPIKWGHRFTHYEVGEDNTVTAFFEDGSMATGDILVGADGLHSPGATMFFIINLAIAHIDVRVYSATHFVPAEPA